MFGIDNVYDYCLKSSVKPDAILKTHFNHKEDTIMRIAKMKVVLMCLAVTGLVFITGCGEDQEPDTSYSVCDFTYKGKSYHFVSDLDYHDPVGYIETSSGGFWSFDFRSTSGVSSYDNMVSIKYDPDSSQNRDKPMVGPHTIEFLELTIGGVEYGTTKNNGAITITRWDYQYGDDAEYIRSICAGSFSGTIIEEDGTESPIEGTFEGTIDDVD